MAIKLTRKLAQKKSAPASSTTEEAENKRTLKMFLQTSRTVSAVYHLGETREVVSVDPLPLLETVELGR